MGEELAVAPFGDYVEVPGAADYGLDGDFPSSLEVDRLAQGEVAAEGVYHSILGQQEFGGELVCFVFEVLSPAVESLVQYQVSELMGDAVTGSVTRAVLGEAEERAWTVYFDPGGEGVDFFELDREGEYEDAVSFQAVDQVRDWCVGLDFEALSGGMCEIARVLSGLVGGAWGAIVFCSWPGCVLPAMRRIGGPAAGWLRRALLGPGKRASLRRGVPLVLC